jgi:8-oxo-dGTP pyrophosphatase MutT (NUDIX family)
MPERPKVCVQGVVRHPDGTRILVTETPGAGFQRLVGGKIEHGELSDAALAREFGEELGVEVEVGALLGVLQNRFEYLGEPCHEVVLVHEVRLVDVALYQRAVLPRVDRDDNRAVWRSLADPPDVPLYAEGWETLL